MDERRIEPHGGFARLQRDLTSLIAFMTNASFVVSQGRLNRSA
jgi:hypothetical protein